MHGKHPPLGNRRVSKVLAHSSFVLQNFIRVRRNGSRGYAILVILINEFHYLVSGLENILRVRPYINCHPPRFRINVYESRGLEISTALVLPFLVRNNSWDQIKRENPLGSFTVSLNRKSYSMLEKGRIHLFLLLFNLVCVQCLQTIAYGVVMVQCLGTIFSEHRIKKNISFIRWE